MRVRRLKPRWKDGRPSWGFRLHLSVIIIKVQHLSDIIKSTVSDCHHYESCYHLQSKNHDLKEYIDRQSGSYSGGNKRKLNVAMSLVDNDNYSVIIVRIAASSKRSSGWRTTSCLSRRAKHRSGSCGKKEPVVHYRLALITLKTPFPGFDELVDHLD